MNTTTAFFRKLSRIEEAMLRAAMPRVSARDGERLFAYGSVENSKRTARTLTVGPLTFRLAEAR
jgi:hypothetical protein